MEFWDRWKVNVNDPKYARGGTLKTISEDKQYNGQWERWLDEHPDASFDEALDFGRQLARDYGLKILF